MSLLFNSPESSTISRWTLLKIFGIGAIVGGTGYSRFSKPEPTVYQKDTLELPQILNKNKSVAVVGGGLAGLACAYELSQRGFAVTLLEKAPNSVEKLPVGRLKLLGKIL